MECDFEKIFSEIEIGVESEEITKLDGVIEQTIQLQEDVTASLETVKRLIGDKKTENYLKTLAPISLWRNNEYLVWNIDAYINEHFPSTKDDEEDKFDYRDNHNNFKSINEQYLFQQQVKKYLNSYSRMNTEKIKIRYALESALKINQRALRHCEVDCDDEDDVFVSPFHSSNKKLKKSRSMSMSLFASHTPEHVSCQSNVRPAFSSFVGKSPGFGSPKSVQKYRRSTMTSSFMSDEYRSGSPNVYNSTTRMMESVDFSTPTKLLMRSQYIRRTASAHSTPRPNRKFDTDFLNISQHNKQINKTPQKCRC